MRIRETQNDPSDFESFNAAIPVCIESNCVGIRGNWPGETADLRRVTCDRIVRIAVTLPTDGQVEVPGELIDSLSSKNAEVEQE